MKWFLFVLKIGYFVAVVNSAKIPESDVKQGLYSSSDYVTILTINNFEKEVYEKPYSFVIQFYNSYCGHCRAFAPKFKNLALEIDSWKKILKLGVIDCAVEENNEICRNFEVMAYPSLRYLHENYIKGNSNIGDPITSIISAESLKVELIKKIQSEQGMGRLRLSPALGIAAYATISAALSDVPRNTLFTFLVFENENSTLGSNLILDINDYENIVVKKVFNDSELAKHVGIKNESGLVAVYPNLEYKKFSFPELSPNILHLLRAVRGFLQANRYQFPIRDLKNDDKNQQFSKEHFLQNADAVYYSDLEKTIKTSLHTEITRHKVLSGEPLKALTDYLDVLIEAYPFKHGNNLKAYLTALNNGIKTKKEWGGSELYDYIKTLEAANAPVYSENLEFVGCKGSQIQYRGYTCGLWTLFHTLTVNAYDKDVNLGPKVLNIMLDYVTNFFGCTECAEHFQAMSTKNRLKDVKGNDKAILWLWIAHNEVNLRLSGDVTEDPDHPKIQFPSAKNCPKCRYEAGGWNLNSVLQYLMKVYEKGHIESTRKARSTDATLGSQQSLFSNLDIGMLSLLYLLSFIMLILIIKYFISKHFFRKRRFKHAWAKSAGTIYY